MAKKPQVDREQVEQFADRGYDSGIDYQTSITNSSMHSGSVAMQFTLLQPVVKGKYPLVIYLPGLGESDDGSTALRQAWAKSGYVVVSLQPLKNDADVWSSSTALNRDYTYLRQQMYTSGIVSERLDRLSKLTAYLERQAESGSPVAQRMDLSRIAIAGFDIGAYTAMIVAGEVPQHVRFAGLPLPVGGVIALSPYADFTGANFEVRYRKIHLPVLSATSDADSDMHGSVPPSLHQAPFQYMPPGDKYLLLLAGASHDVIGNHSRSQLSSTGSSTRQDESSEESAAESAAVRGAGASPTQHAMMEVALEQTTTAFLNAYIKKDQFSLNWLRNDTQRWLDQMGQIKEK